MSSILDFGFCYATDPEQVANYTLLLNAVETNFSNPAVLTALKSKLAEADLDDNDRQELSKVIDYYVYDAGRELRDVEKQPNLSGLPTETQLAAGKAITVKPYMRRGRRVSGYTREGIRKLDPQMLDMINYAASKPDKDKTWGDMVYAGSAVMELVDRNEARQAAKAEVARVRGQIDSARERYNQIATIYKQGIEGQNEINRANPDLEHPELLKLYYGHGVGDRQIKAKVVALMTQDEIDNEDNWSFHENAAGRPDQSLQVDRVEKQIDKKIIELQQPFFRAQQDYGFAHMKALKGVLKQIRPGFGSSEPRMVEGDVLDQLRDARGLQPEPEYEPGAQLAVQQAGLMLPKEWVDEANDAGLVAVFLNPVDEETYSRGRGYHVWQPSRVEHANHSDIFMSGDSTSTGLHEFLHRIQNTRPNVARLEQEYHAHRTMNERLSQLFDGKDLGEGVEWSKPDKFITPYAGKMYRESSGWEAKELLTVGTSQVWLPNESGDGDIWDEDVGTAQFILGLLATA